MSNSVITLSVFLSIMIVCMFILDIKFAIPFAKKMAEIYRKRKEVDSNTVINHISFITMDFIMIVAYLMLGYSNPFRIVLTIAGLGVGASIFMLGYQVSVAVKGYRDGKARVANTTEDIKQTVASTEDSKVDESSSTETTKGTDAEVESTNKEESKGTEPTSEADKANDTSSEETHNNEAEVK